MFTEKDLQQIAAHGLTLEAVEKQVENFRDLSHSRLLVPPLLPTVL